MNAKLLPQITVAHSLSIHVISESVSLNAFYPEIGLLKLLV